MAASLTLSTASASAFYFPYPHSVSSQPNSMINASMLPSAILGPVAAIRPNMQAYSALSNLLIPPPLLNVLPQTISRSSTPNPEPTVSGIQPTNAIGIPISIPLAPPRTKFNLTTLPALPSLPLPRLENALIFDSLKETPQQQDYKQHEQHEQRQLLSVATSCDSKQVDSVNAALLAATVATKNSFQTGMNVHGSTQTAGLRTSGNISGNAGYVVNNSSIGVGNRENSSWNPFQSVKIRIGIHSGTGVGGVIGMNRPRFLIWGRDAIIANKMEATAPANAIQMTSATYDMLCSSPAYHEDEYEIVRRAQLSVLLSQMPNTNTNTQNKPTAASTGHTMPTAISGSSSSGAGTDEQGSRASASNDVVSLDTLVFRLKPKTDQMKLIEDYYQ